MNSFDHHKRNCRVLPGSAAPPRETGLRNLKGGLIALALLIASAHAPFNAALTAPLSGEQIVAGIQARYGGLSSLSADFTQVYRSATGRVLTESGRLLLKRPNKMRWEYVDPEVKIFISTGRKTYFFVPDDRQVTESDIRESNDPQLPFLFLLRRSNIKKDFESVEIAGDENPVRPGDVVIRVVARKASAEFRNILVEVNPGNFQIVRVARIEPSDTRNDFILSNVRENPPAPEALFQFNAPAGVQVMKGG